MILLKCQDLAVGYDNQAILRDINLEITNGDYICIIGKNGSGKSTLMKTLVNLLPPVSGKFKYDKTVRAKSIGYLPQQIQVQADFPASVYEAVLSGCLNRLGYYPFFKRAEKELANRYLKMLEIDEIRNKPFSRLSGGQQQRVLLARALCSTEKILFLDEPFAGIDVLMARQLYHIINRINKELGVTIVLISHDLNSVLHDTNRIFHVQDTLLFEGSTENYLKSEIGHRYLGDKL